MRVHLRTVWEFADDGALRLVEDISYEYAGPVALAKKGRKEQEELIRRQMEQAKVEEQRRSQDLALREQERQAYEAEKAKSEPFVSGLESTTPGTLSSLSQSQYASDLGNINKTYGDLNEASLRNLAARGFGRAPSGFTTSAINTNAEQKGRAETDAYRQALQRTYEQGLQALSYRTGQQGLAQNQQQIAQSGANSAGQTGLQQNEQSSQAALRRSQMGSGIGDVIGGISDLAGAAGAVMTGGASSGLSGLSSRLYDVGKKGGLPVNTRTISGSLNQYRNLGY